MKLNVRSEKNLTGVHDKLQAVIRLAAVEPPYDFVVTEGLRTLERQKQMVAEKKSQTLKSRHLTGHAVDLAIIIDNKANWEVPKYRELHACIQKAADDLGVKIRWGGTFSFVDAVHWELDANVFPA